VPPRVIIDCDPGLDDVLAIAFAAHFAEVVAITTVAGNAPLHHTTRNAHYIRELLGLAVPIHQGAAAPLVAATVPEETFHGQDGLGGIRPAGIEPELAATPAVDAILDAADRYDDLWLVAIGPLTNVALALAREPALGERLAGVSIMGGGTQGNVTAAAEFNIWFDPEAAWTTFRSGAPATLLCPLDATHQLLVRDADAVRAEAAGPFCGSLMRTLLGRAEELTGARESHLHDTTALAALTHPHLFGFVDFPVTVELAGRETRGQTLIDRRSYTTETWPRLSVAEEVDGPAIVELQHEALVALGR
jgi:inosine-uridine nucleoside N-ribohydrolase